jgi:hypothetical protein
MSPNRSKFLSRLKQKSYFTDYILSNYTTPKNPRWDYEVISVRLYVKHLLRHGHVQCNYGTNYALYELNDNFLKYTVRKGFNEEFIEPKTEIKLPLFFKELRLVFVLLIHKILFFQDPLSES